MKVYRGNPAAARSYVEADHARVDDYYLAEGTGLAERLVATPEGGVVAAGALDGDGYEAWVAGLDPASGEPRGRLRTDPSAVRFVEVVVNGPKTWSLAAALDPEIAAAYDAAQEGAAREIVGWLAGHATTRVGPRGGQLQVPVERIEAAVVRHYTSRAGDPHRHLHLQVNARVFAEGKWRGLHTFGVRDFIDAINGIGHAAVMCDPQFRSVLAARGFSLDPATGEVAELAGYVGVFSARARQIGANLDRYETDWRQAHPGGVPGPELLRAWDRRAWAQARPDKVVPTDGGELTDRWVAELHRLGFRDPTRPAHPNALKPGSLDRDAAVTVVLARLGARRSAWNAADIRGQVELLIAGANVVAEPAVRTELAEDLTARTVAACVRLLAEDGAPEHIRALTSREVLAVEAHLTAAFAARASAPARSARIRGGQLDATQLRAVEALAGTHRLVVVEGAAGAGKTATLAATRTLLAQTGHRLVVVTPTLRAAQVAAGQVGSRAFSAAWLARQHGFRWNEDGQWTRVATDPRAEALLGPGDLLLVDEAGMLDQDTTRALLTIADQAGARLALVGDRHQLPAVGRGGVLDLAARWTHPDAYLTLGAVHRFTDPTYARLSLAMRTGDHPDAVFDQLADRGQIVIHADEAARTAALAAALVDQAAETGALVVADTREQVADLNAAIHDRLIAAGQVDAARGLLTAAGERLCVGDKVATRRNDYDLGVANRDTWTVTALDDDGTLHLTGQAGTRVVPVGYAAQYIELAYATTCYGAQGETVPTAHLVLGEHTGAAAAYVAMTRGRETNTAHLVADSLQDARGQWIQTFTRDRADLGPAHAAKLAARESAKYANGRPLGRSRYVSRSRRPASARPAPGAARGGSPLPTPAPARDPGRAPGIGF
ncbi:MAG TPA: MobF family relaxase [Nocardioidaceae bacterium]|nr:MobF family relaxase [Nocardioidaceae bacterium]